MGKGVYARGKQVLDFHGASQKVSKGLGLSEKLSEKQLGLCTLSPPAPQCLKTGGLGNLGIRERQV